jgi:AraC-like DNA-binding protein
MRRCSAPGLSVSGNRLSFFDRPRMMGGDAWAALRVPTMTIVRSDRRPSRGPAPQDLRLPARYYLLLCEALDALGVDSALVLRRAGVAASRLADSEGSLSLAESERLLEAAEVQSGRADLGVELGRRIRLCTPSLAAALRLLARYSRLVAPLFAGRYRSDDDGAEFSLRPIAPMSARNLRFHFERFAVGVCCQTADLAGAAHCNLLVHIDGAAADARRIRAAIPSRCRVIVEPEGLPSIRARFDARLLARPIRHANRGGLAMAEARCEAMLRRIEHHGRLTDWLTMMLRQAGDGLPSRQEIARILNLPVHTLERRLRDEGSGFRALSNTVRHQRACELLADARVSITEIALQLGYSDAANFTRAFRRVAGVAPATFRSQGRRDRSPPPSRL